MEQIPVFFENVRRSALTLKPKKPFQDWLTNIDPDDKDIDLTQDSIVYLLPDFEETRQMGNWLKKNFDQLFCDQMNNWYTDESCWIPNRTFKLFKEWFDYSLHTMIMDTLDTPIEKE